MKPTSDSKYELAMDNINDMIMFEAKLRMIFIGIFLGIGLLTVILVLIFYKRCCGSRILCTGRIISQNIGEESRMQPTYAQQFYPAPNITVQNQPSPNIQNNQDSRQPLMMSQHQEQYPLPPSYRE